MQSRMLRNLVSRPVAELNLTSLMDLTFLLLITFIITFPLMQQGIPMNLPKASANEIQADEPWRVSVSREGRMYLNEVLVQPDALRARMVEVQRSTPDKAVLVKADEGLAYARVVDVLKILHEARITRITLVTEAERR